MLRRALVSVLWTVAAAVSLSGGIAAAPPPAATPLAPSGIIQGSTQVFSWAPAAGATWYRLWIDDAAKAQRWDRWYTAAQAGCAGGAGTCALPVSLGLAPGEARWWVQSWSGDGSGPWSAGLVFHVANTPAAWNLPITSTERFQLVLGGEGVLDRETGLVWERAPSAQSDVWDAAVAICRNRSTQRAGWRLPTVEEIQTLSDGTRTAPPYLPPGHPFLNVETGEDDFYWTLTDSNLTDDTADVGSFHYRFAWTARSKASRQYRWCVRGPGGFRTAY